MKIIIWGTGAFYQYYKSYLEEFEILCIIDNDRRKHGTIIDEKMVYAPNQVDYAESDYVVILVKNYAEICKQLDALGVSKDKIIVMDTLKKIVHKELIIRRGKKEVGLGEWNEKGEGKRILLVSHGLSRTGVPIALMNLAILLRKMGYSVLYMSMSMAHGTLCEELQENEIDYLVYDIYINKGNQACDDFIKGFDLILFGTVVLQKHIDFFAGFNKPIIWWIHESNEIMLGPIRNRVLPQNVYIYAGGQRVVRALKKYAGISVVHELLYFLFDDVQNREKKKKDKILRFALLGTFMDRKGQDILAEASNLISEKYKDSYEIVFVGEPSSKAFYNRLKVEYPDLTYLDEMNQAQLDEFYKEIDVLVCPSRDDPMPIVVTQAMQNGIPCIISDQVGQCEYITHGTDGFVFESENKEELAKIMEWMMDNQSSLAEIGERSRDIYENYFSENKARHEIMLIFNEIMN